MSNELPVRNWREYVDRFSVQLEVSNYKDLVAVELGVLPADRVRRCRISGVVDTGATRLVLPGSAVDALGLADAGEVTVRLADGQRYQKTLVSDAHVQIQGRSSVFTAVVEPGRSDALVGAIVLEELDFVPDCIAQALVPRDAHGIFAEID